jgi:hypothetical protein
MFEIYIKFLHVDSKMNDQYFKIIWIKWQIFVVKHQILTCVLENEYLWYFKKKLKLNDQYLLWTVTNLRFKNRLMCKTKWI